MVPSGVGGNILGGWIVKKWQLSCNKMLELYTYISVVACLTVTMFLVQCANPDFAGVTISAEHTKNFTR